MKFAPSSEKIALKNRKALNQACLNALEHDPPNMEPEEIFQKFTGVGGGYTD